MAGIAAGEIRQFRALLGVRARLALRRFKGRRNEAFATIAFLAIMIPMPIVLAYLSFVGYRKLDPPWNAEILGVVLTGLWLFWLTAPLFGNALNEELDLPRLLALPIRRRVVIAATLAGTIFDIWMIFAIPFGIAAIAGWTQVRGVVVVAVLLAFALLVSTGQLVAAALSGLARSRRFRDAAVVLGSLLLVGWYWLNVHSNLDHVDTDRLLQRLTTSGIHPLAVLQWTPPGACARAVERAQAGATGAALAWFGLGLAWLAVFVWLWWRTIEYVSTNGEISFGQPRRVEHAARVTTKTHARGPRGGRLASLVRVDLALMWRNPRRRMLTLQAALLPMIFLVAMRGEGTASPMNVFAPAMYVGIACMMGLQNLLALDGKGIATLFLSPLVRADLFRARAGSFAVVMAAPIVAFCAYLGVQRSPVNGVIGLLLAASVYLVFAAISSGLSARFAVPVRQQGRRTFSGRGLSVESVVLGLLQPIMVVGLWSPVGVAILLVMHFGSTAGVVVTAALGVVYGWIAFRIGVRLAGDAMLAHEPDHFLTLELGKST